ncbi:MAG: hypothetical protein ACXVZO_03415, partial [Gaiellaceae bacterium]
MAIVASVLIAVAATFALRAFDAIGAADHLLSFFQSLTPRRMIEVLGGLALGLAVGSLAARHGGVQAAGVRVLRPGRRWAHAVAGCPAILSLTVIVALTAVLRTLIDAGETIPRVLGDELIYSDLGKSLAQHGELLVRGRTSIGYSLFYPLFASPFYRLAADGAVAFATLKAAQATVMALTAVPAYFLARRLVGHGWALAVAFLSISGGWMEYSALAMTEALFYPVFTAFALAFVRMLERPTVRRQLVALALLGVLIGIRPQALVLVASLLVAIALQGLLDGSLARTVSTYSATFLVLGLALAGAALAGLAGLPLPTGAYGVLFSVHYNPLRVVKWGAWNLAAYELSLGVVALAALPLAIVALLRSARREERAFAVAGVTLVGGILLSVSALSASPYGLDVLHERSLFFVTPIVLACFAYWLANGLERSWRVALGTALVVVLVAATVPESLIRRTNIVDGPTSWTLLGLDQIPAEVAAQRWWVIFALLGAGVFLFARRRLAPLLLLVAALFWVTAATAWKGPLSVQQDRALAWVDHSLPSEASATVVNVGLPIDLRVVCAKPAETAEQNLVVWTEFFNTRIDRVVHVSTPAAADALPSPELLEGEQGVLLDQARMIAPAYVVLDSRLAVVGRRIARFDLSTLGSRFTDGASLSL